MRKPHRARDVVRIVTGVVLGGAFAWYVAAHPELLRPIATLTLPVLAIVVGLRVVAGLLGYAMTLLLLRPSAPRVRFVEVILLTTSGVIGNLVAPFAGAAVKAVYLERRHQLGYAELGGVLALMGAIRILAGGLIALLALGVLVARASPPGIEAWGLATLTTVGGLALLVAGKWLGQWASKWPMLGRLDAAWRHLASDPARRRPVFLLAIARTIVSCASFGVLCAAMTEISEGFLAGTAMSAVGVSLDVVKATPGNLGLYEALAAAVGDALGVAFGTGLVIAAASRVAGYASMALVTVVALVVAPPDRTAKDPTTD